MSGANNFYRSNNAPSQPITFQNQFKMTIAANLFVPQDFDTGVRAPAIVVGHPMGAVKEQSANLYANKLAEQGFVTVSVDLSFWGGSEGEPRNAVLPDMYVETFSAAVDYLTLQDFVDPERIGALGICGSGSFAIGAAKIDSRIKAVATVSMYDMGAACRNGLRKTQSVEQRKAAIASATQQRSVEAAGGEAQYTSGTVHELTADTPDIQREFYDFYRTSRGEYTPPGSTRALTTHSTLSSIVRFVNFYPFNDIDTISPRPVLFVSGDLSHSREFSEDAYASAAEPKELYWVPGAGHVDLYDRTGLIPFAKFTEFFQSGLALDNTAAE
ncbi:hypothetical protein PHYSODRAFT_505316 [Phytophthora sojae]|uniref:Xaa-Pro dipeptidyl-peptidase-like domain-containing protein n=1 Tax=Phytophthora sojae (strain P6497) TaxID=1094619 RepID=G4ZQG1_PHYSP|nr:hypothetical protein PHYSODRAFT_505316 [Phytophthora sojae]EGZ15489.1 hypothetical protein PHYSODRAFT_505316 [Phytophthora sojae]|eukprot:XP_009529238.1 hypothetical protein PHYSODRAFT_505316 [Phytophthora sojae]